MIKKKVLYVSETLSLYNDPIYKLMNKHVNLTYAYILKTEVKESDYQIIQFPHKKIGKAIFLCNMYEIMNSYDVVIFTPHLKFLNLIVVPFLPRKFKLISWSIGLYVSYNRKYDLDTKPDVWDHFFELIQDSCDACIFYMPQPIEYWCRYRNINRKKYFVAHNTVKIAEINKMPPFENRDIFLFVGTLYQQKGIGELLVAYSQAKTKINNLPALKIIGNGPEKALIQQQILDLGIADKVSLDGAIYDEEVLKKYFLKSLLCISPKQAGLSVQKSLGYGTPFVTRPDAITGGERLDIINGVNGLFYSSMEELTQIFINSVLDPSQIKDLSVNARKYYLENATPEIMVDGALDAIRYVLKS